MNFSRISIIVPIYNSENFLEKCIKSIIQQTYRELEIILVNDGSIDESLNICNRYAAEDDRIIVIDKLNGGVPSARNKGLEIATGNYVGFVDSDDYISPNMFEKLHSAALNKDADIVECGYFTVAFDYDLLQKHSLKENIIVSGLKCSYNYLAQINTKNFCWNKLYKRSLFKNISFSNLKVSEDYVLNAKLFFKCNKKVVIEDCLYYYVSCPGSITKQPFSERKLDAISAGKEVLDFYCIHEPELCKYPILYILNYIRKLYVELMNSKIENKDTIKNRLVLEYNNYYPLIRKKLYRTVKYKKTFIALWIFDKSPNLYYSIEKIRGFEK